MSALQATTGKRLSAISAAAIMAIPAAASADTGEPVPAYSWSRSTPAAVANNHFFAGTAAFGAHDAWSVGAEYTAQGEVALAEHWNGTGWTRTPTPFAGRLTSVAGTGSADVWAVGNSVDLTSSAILHWNGTGWTPVPHVAASAGEPVALNAVTAISPTDAWAVGSKGDFLASTPLAQHWNGSAWVETPVPAPAGVILSQLLGVAAFNGSTVWASGVAVTEEFEFVPYFVRWNGSAWSAVTVPATISGGYSDLVVTGPNSIVASGSAQGDPSPTPVVASYTDGTWKQEWLPLASGELNGIATNGSNGFWIVGDRVGATHEARSPVVLSRTVTGAWRIAPVPAVGVGGLRDIARVPGRGLMVAVGATGVTEDTQQGLIYQYR